jgi:hypothetical protein
MKVFDITTIKPQMGSTKTYEDFAKFLGMAPHRLGIVSSMYSDLTASYLTESLMNIYTNQKSPSKFQSINAFMFEWEINVDFIKRVKFAAVPVGNGANGSDIVMAFQERYYEKYDTFRIEGSRQLCIVKQGPIRKSDKYWEVIVQIIDNDYQSILDTSYTQVGMETRFISNYMPELSEEGYTKYQSNIERHRNYISTHRNDVSFSSQFAALEDVFIDIGKNKGKGTSTETIYKMKKKELELLENFMYVRNNALLFGKTNVDVDGKPTVFDPDTHRPIIIGDGIINQIERYANKYAYAKLSINVFDTVMEHMRQKSKSSTGNQYTFVVNERLWNQVQRTLRQYLKDWRTDGTFFYSSKAGGNVKVGATFDTYVFGGNQISFHVDKALTLEYPDKGYGLVIDLTADATSGTPALQMFTVKGGEFIRGVLKGVGGLDGVSSGDVYTPVAGSKLIHMGYAGVGVMNPYRSYMIQEQ